MTGARLWAVFGFGGLALLGPPLFIADAADVITGYVFLVWLLIVVLTGLIARRAP